MRQPFAFLDDDLQGVLLFRIAQVRLLLQSFGVEPDERQGRLELMGDRMDEFRLPGRELGFAGDIPNHETGPDRHQGHHDQNEQAIKDVFPGSGTIEIEHGGLGNDQLEGKRKLPERKRDRPRGRRGNGR